MLTTTKHCQQCIWGRWQSFRWFPTPTGTIKLFYIILYINQRRIDPFIRHLAGLFSSVIAYGSNPACC